MPQDLNVRINERARELAEEVLRKAGITLDVAINRYLCAIAVTKSVPYREDIALPDDSPEEKPAPVSLEELGRQVAQNYSGENTDHKHIFAEIERRYGL